MRVLIVIGLAVFLAACARFHNVTVDDIRAPEYKRAEGTIPMGIPAIQQAMRDYAAACSRDFGPLRPNPSIPGRAMYTATLSSSPGSSVVLLVDLQQIGTSTRYQGYSYYKTGEARLDDTIYAMSGGKQCRGREK